MEASMASIGGVMAPSNWCQPQKQLMQVWLGRFGRIQGVTQGRELQLRDKTQRNCSSKDCTFLFFFNEPCISASPLPLWELLIGYN